MKSRTKSRITKASIQTHGAAPVPGNPYGKPRFRPRRPTEILLRIEGETYRYDLTAEGQFEGMRIAEVLVDLAATMVRSDTTDGELRLPAHPADASPDYIGVDFGASEVHIQLSHRKMPFDLAGRILEDTVPPSLEPDSDLPGLSGRTTPGYMDCGQSLRLPCDPIFQLWNPLTYALNLSEAAAERIWSGLSPSELHALATVPGARVARFPAGGPAPNASEVPVASKVCEYCGGQPQRWDPDRKMMAPGGRCGHCGAGG